MRPLLMVLPLLLLLRAVSWPQTSSSMGASPAAMASPAPGPSGGMMGQPRTGWPPPYPPWCEFHPDLLARCGLWPSFSGAY
jgi:hypothetical protein